MLSNVIEYLDAAKRRNGISSDRQLCASLGLTGTAVFQIRRGSAFPSEPTMVRIAHLAGENEDLAVLQLQLWKNHGTEAEPVFRRILQTISKGAAVFLLAATTYSLSSHSAAAENSVGTFQPHVSRIVHIME